jgi:DDE superfamily endonuclease
MTFLAPADRRFFPPEVAMHVVKLACERPELRGRSLSTWDCTEIARELIRSGVVSAISAQTVQRILEHHKLKPWRTHLWLSPKAPRNAAFVEQVRQVCELYTRPLEAHEIVLSIDEKTSIQPRPRLAPTTAAKPQQPVRIEHEYKRVGAVNLLAAFDTRTGKVIGRCYDRKRQVEFIEFLEVLEREIPGAIRIIHVVLDNVRVHKGKLVQAWLAAHPRFVFHFTPVHCSWMNQVEQWFSILQRKRLRLADFADKADLAAKMLTFIDQYNEHAHPFNWNTKSVAKVMTWAERRCQLAAA